MPHAVSEFEPPNVVSRKQASKSKQLSREHRSLQRTFADIQFRYALSGLSQNLASHLAYVHKTSGTPIQKIISLGLGSIATPGNGQSRRLKQLAIFLAIKEELERAAGLKIDLYAQDPVFTRTDEMFLSAHSVEILRTTSGSSLGDAASIIDASTIVYSPFLTLEAYEVLLLSSEHDHGNGGSGFRVNCFIGDDFNALEAKWPKKSEERVQVEKVMKGAVRKFRRRLISGDGFWAEGDGAFGMAVYVQRTENLRREKARI